MVQTPPKNIYKPLGAVINPPRRYLQGRLETTLKSLYYKIVGVVLNTPHRYLWKRFKTPLVGTDKGSSKPPLIGTYKGNLKPPLKHFTKLWGWL